MPGVTSPAAERDAGRERDAKLHTLLTGEVVEWRPTKISPDCGIEETCWFCDPLVNARNPTRVVVCDHSDEELQPAFAGSMTFDVVPRYSSEWEAMGLVVETMRAKGFMCELLIGNVGSRANFATPSRMRNYDYYEIADTAPKAVALAAVAALGGK